MNKVGNRDYIIPIKGMSVGKHRLDFTIDNEFFEEYENREIKGANLNVEVELEKSTLLIEIKARILGVVVMECDRCLDDLRLEMDREASLMVKFVKSAREEDNDEIMTLDPAESELDLKQFLYDYICLGLPLQRVHKDGECNPEMIKKLGDFSNSRNTGENPPSPFEKLKDLMN